MDAEILGAIFRNAKPLRVVEFAPAITSVMEEREIDTPLRQAHFLAQIGHESGELRWLEEIANGSAYEGRKDLGNTQRGDGRRFKGRGLIQLTGRANYTQYARNVGREAEILSNPALVSEDQNLCVDVAGWYWTTRNLNKWADRDDLRAVTKRVNGGYRGYNDRQRLLRIAKAELGV